MSLILMRLWIRLIKRTVRASKYRTRNNGIKQGMIPGQDKCNGRAKDSEDIRGVLKPYDWTYTTPYRGSLTQDVIPFAADHTDREAFTTSKEDLPLDKLRRPDPILFFDEVDLYEDELGDNGMSLLSIKVRVMPARLLLLARFFLRLDDVIFRVRDTRIYVEFETGQVIRDYTALEGVYSKLKEVLPVFSLLLFPLP